MTDQSTKLEASASESHIEGKLVAISKLNNFFSFLEGPVVKSYNNFCFSFIQRNYKPIDPAHDIDHLLRVLKNAFAIAEYHPRVDQCVLLIACYFHDYLSFSKKTAVLSNISSRVTADQVRNIFKKQGLSDEQLDKVQNAIVAHSYSNQIRGDYIESDILYDADKIDAVGAIGVARLFCVSGAINSRLYDFSDPFFETREPDDKKFALDHFYKKLIVLPQKMRTPEGRMIACKRVAFVKKFLEQMKDEIGQTNYSHV